MSITTTAAPLGTTVSTIPVRCAALRQDCDLCLSSGCSYCLVSNSMPGSSQVGPSSVSNPDYACVMGGCQLTLVSRPNTQYYKALTARDCTSAALPTQAQTSTQTTTPPAPTVGGSEQVGVGTPQPPDPQKWPNNWGAIQWFAVSAPLGVLLAIGCCLYVRAVQKKQTRVHVAPDEALPGFSAEEGSDGAVLWDFSQAGPLSPEQIQGAEGLLAEAVRAARRAGLPPPRRRILLGPRNDLRKGQLAALDGLLQRHPEVSVAFEGDWRGAGDPVVEELCRLLRMRGRCTVRSQTKGDVRLRLSAHTAPAILGDLAEVLATAGHDGVDAISLEVLGSMIGAAVPPVVVALNSLRLSPHELVLSRQHVGDAGCGAACGFMRPWSGRLLAARFLECEIGDAGACEIARLLLGEAKRAANAAAAGAAPNLRELVLSANRIGDRGITQIAEALPKCDALERLLVDRNLIGTDGARALARRLPRSSVRELVLGSHLGGNCLGALGVEAIARALDDEMERAAANRATRLEALALEGCGTGELGAKALAAALPKSAVTVLSVAQGQLGPLGAEALLEALPEWVLSVDLAGNELGDELGAAVAQVLARIPSLSLSLAQNDLSPGLKIALREKHGARLRV